MTKPRDPEELLTDYLSEGMQVLPDRVVDAVLDEVHRTHQRAVRPWRTQPMFKPALAAAALVTVLAVVTAASLGAFRPSVSVPVASTSPQSTEPATVGVSPSPTGPSSPTSPPPAGEQRDVIAFVRVEREVGAPPPGARGLRVWTVNADGSNAHRLNPELHVDSYVAWWPDGSRVLAVVESDIYTVDARTGAAEPIGDKCRAPCAFRSVRQPSVSADGSTVVFVQFLETGNENAPDSVIRTVDVATGAVTTLDSTLLRGAYDVCMPNGTACSGPSNASPAFSNDGRQIAFVREVERAVRSSGNPLGFPTNHGDLVVMNADGTGIRVLDLGGLSAADPVWAPDGSRLLFTSYVEEYVADRPGGPANTLHSLRDIYTVAVDGTDLRRLTDNRTSSGAAWVDDNSVRFLRYEGEGALQGGGVPNWWRIDADGSGPERLTFFDDASSVIFEPAGLESGRSAWFSQP
jgi:hypothetical protein